MDILGDLGGTHLRLVTAAAPDQIYQYVVATYESFETAMDDFLNRAGLLGKEINTFYLASAVTPQNGVIEDQRFGTSPGKWRIELETIKNKYAISHLMVLNDLEAATYALMGVSTQDMPLIVDGKGAVRHAHKILVGVGTGIGHAFLITPPAEYGRPFVHKTHGGHIAAMAPSPEWQAWIGTVRGRLQPDREPIWEDFVSGHGIKKIYCAIHGLDVVADVPTEKIIGDDPTVQAYAEGLGHYCHLLVGVTGIYGGLYLYGGMIEALWSAGRLHTESFKKGFLRRMVPSVRADLESVGVYYAGASVSAIKGLCEFRKMRP